MRNWGEIQHDIRGTLSLIILGHGSAAIPKISQVRISMSSIMRVTLELASLAMRNGESIKKKRKTTTKTKK